MAKTLTMVEVLGIFLILVIALALTPSIATSTVQAQYSQFTDSKVIVVATSNATTLTYAAENASTGALNDLWWTITLNQTDVYGLTTVLFASGNVSLTATSTLTFAGGGGTGQGCLTTGKTYLVTITYNALEASGPIQALVTLVPLFWIIAIIAAAVVIIYKVLQGM
jgi:hypothetical protein